MRKPAFCIGENKAADQRGNRKADPKYEISSLQPSSVAVQPGFCGTWSEISIPVFSQRGSYALFLEKWQSYSSIR